MPSVARGGVSSRRRKRNEPEHGCLADRPENEKGISDPLDGAAFDVDEGAAGPTDLQQRDHDGLQLAELVVQQRADLEAPAAEDLDEQRRCHARVVGVTMQAGKCTTEVAQLLLTFRTNKQFLHL